MTSHNKPTSTSGGSLGDKVRGAFTGAFSIGESVRTNVLDAADAVTGTGKYRSDGSNDTSSAYHTHPATAAPTSSHQLPSEEAGARSISTTSGSSSGVGAGANPMRASGLTDEDAKTVARMQRSEALQERDMDPATSAAGAHTGAGAGLPSGGGAQSTGPAVAGAAPAGPGMMGNAVV